jgi:hypothetical protein
MTDYNSVKLNCKFTHLDDEKWRKSLKSTDYAWHGSFIAAISRATLIPNPLKYSL